MRDSPAEPPPDGDGTGDRSGDRTGDSTGDRSGDDTGDRTGDRSGDRTGDGTGDRSGDGTGDRTGDGTGDSTEAPPEPAPAAVTLPAASAAPRPAEDDEDDDEDEDEDFQFLRCEGCGQDSARPRLLGCLHTLCPGCLSDGERCPLCPPGPGPGTGTASMDNLLFCSLRGRLRLWEQLRSPGGPGCGRCRAEAALVWCEECEEFFCGRCLQDHQWWHKKKEHRVRGVEELRAGSARHFLEATRGSCSLFCSSCSHAGESRVCSIYCPRCERALCCACALLDTRHAPFRDLRAESRRRRAELRSLRQDLRQLRGAFEASLRRLRGEAARREEQRRRLRERVRDSAERLQQLLRAEAEQLRALLDEPERGRAGLAAELRGAEGAVRRLRAAERLAGRLGRYGGEQELLDMQPFVRAAVLRLRRLRPPEPPEPREPAELVECRARLRAMVERVTGRQGTDFPELEEALEDGPKEDLTAPKAWRDSPGPEEIGTEKPPTVHRGSQVYPRLLKLESDLELGPSQHQSRWEFHTEPGPSAPRDTGDGSIIICSSDSDDEDAVVLAVTPEPRPC